MIGLAIAALLLATAAIAVILIHPAALYDEVETLTWPRHFTREAWQEHPHERSRMARDLAASGALAGKSADWLRQTLGAPEPPASTRPDAVLMWPVPSPQRPDDDLVVQLRHGVAARWGVTSDALTVVE